MIDALVFDFDGLILDSETPDYDAWCAVYRAHGAEMPFDRWLQSVGSNSDLFDPYIDLAERCGRPLDRETLRAAYRGHFFAIVAQQPLLPGVETLISTARARGLKLAVASSGSRRWVVGTLEERGLLPYFDAIRTADDVARVKPDPQLYREATAALGVAPARALAFEDSVNGLRAAKAAGLWCVAVPNTVTRHLDFSAADLVVESLAALPLDEMVRRAVRPTP